MSTSTVENKGNITATRSIPTVYTICPVLVASHVAVEKGWLKKELKAAGADLKYLYSLPAEDWISHFDHRLPDSFRDGGNIPAIWAKSNGRDTKLVGLTFSRTGGQILVRAGSGIHRIADLRGKKIGLSRRLLNDRVDFWRITAHRGILLALDLAGLKPGDVEIVDLSVAGTGFVSDQPVKKPSERFTSRQNGSLYAVETEALQRGEVDAIYSNHGATERIVETGEATPVEDLGRYPDWTLQVANSPYTITVSAELTRTHPEAVVAFLRASIRAGRWIREHPEEAGKIFETVTSHHAAEAARELTGYNLVPNLSPKNIAGIEVEKRFLLEHGYITRDFNIREWVDSRFLEEALKSL